MDNHDHRHPVSPQECYDDCVEFTTSLGKFFLPVRATIPEHVLTFPQNFDFAYCPVRETAKRTFTLRNSGQLESAFHWEILAPFDITPRTGTLKPGESMQMTADFSPKVK